MTTHFVLSSNAKSAASREISVLSVSAVTHLRSAVGRENERVGQRGVVLVARGVVLSFHHVGESLFELRFCEVLLVMNVRGGECHTHD